METSLRFGGNSKALRIHAKDKHSIDLNTHLQVHGELDTKVGEPSYFCAMIRHFYPDLSASFGVGFLYNKHEKIRYTVRGKKAFPITEDDRLSFIVKGRCEVDSGFKQSKSKGAAELSWSIFNLEKFQSFRVKVGYEVEEKVPYLQIKENEWTLNADLNGRWNVRFDL